MKKYDQIHETVLKDIFDIYNGVKDLSKGELENMVQSHKKGRSISSVARKSNDLICVFPVLASRNISIDVQAMISKAIEKNCVAMMQMIFSAIPVSDADNAFDYISQFHTNINKSAKMINLDDVIQVADSIVSKESYIEGTKPDYKILSEVQRDMKNLHYYLEDEISTQSIAEGFSCKLDPSGKFMVTGEVRRIIKEDSDQAKNQVDNNGGVNKDLKEDPKLKKQWPTEKIDHDTAQRMQHMQDEIKKKDEEIYQLNMAARGREKAFNKTYEKLLQAGEDDRKKLNQLQSEREYRKRREDDQLLANKQEEFFSKQILPSEFKKANELMPTLMVVNFKVKTDNGFETIDSVIIGIKAKLYPMSSEDMVTHLVSKAKDANWMTKLIKASTREISFFKDFLFAIDKAKIDALSMSRRGSSNMMWKVLERRAIKSRFNRLMARSNDASAITTLLISQNEVDFIKKEYHIDITDVRNTKVIMEQYNLLGMSIADESLEIAKFMWDTGEDLWENVSFGNLERESNDNTYKKVVNLMTKVM